jgi:hypothetical protein
LGNIHNYTAYHHLQGLNTDLVYFGMLKNQLKKRKIEIEIEKYVENKLHVKIKNKWKNKMEKSLGHNPQCVSRTHSINR